jgi:hypothetical protein
MIKVENDFPSASLRNLDIISEVDTDGFGAFDNQRRRECSSAWGHHGSGLPISVGSTHPSIAGRESLRPIGPRARTREVCRRLRESAAEAVPLSSEKAHLL